MSNQLIDLTGQTFTRLTVLERAVNNPRGNAMWLCLCECGETRVVRGADLRRGQQVSCGCLSAEISSQQRTTHGHARNRRTGQPKSPTYQSWISMRSRCQNPNAVGYEYWGGRGITICPEWDSFETFLADMGERPDGTSLDRIDNDLLIDSYSKDNCRWATPKEQVANRRVS